MLVVETIAKIRRYYFREGKSIKGISRELRISRNTVRKVLRSGETAHNYSRDQQPYPRLGQYVERLSSLLQENICRPKKQRLTARRLYEQLEIEGYEGGYDSVQRYVKKWLQKEGRKQHSQVFIPLYFQPGDAYQFDWSHEHVVLGGVPQKIKVAHFRLCHSRKFFVIAYPRETLEMVLDAHDRAFEFFGGVCRRGIYDNMSTAVTRVLTGKEREFNARFMQMCSHYLIEPVACTPGAGWEKGQVEKQVQDIRRWLFAPKPRFSDFKELNAWLADRCQRLSETRKHPTDKHRTIAEVFAAEKDCLAPVQKAFNGSTESECRVLSTSLVRYDRNHYSVVCKAAGTVVTVRATANIIKILKNSEVLAEHQRQFGRDKTIYDPWHYLEALRRKPGALRNGAPFQKWQLPTGLRMVQKQLMQRLGGDREFVAILCAASRHGFEPVETACRKAMAHGTIRGEVILNLIARETEPSPPEQVAAPQALQLHEEPVADCGRYDDLRKGGGLCSGMN